ncbi:acyltransferase [Enterobacter kobei]|nr:acyltransferase [Enterobacter kobei]
MEQPWPFCYLILITRYYFNILQEQTIGINDYRRKGTMNRLGYIDYIKAFAILLVLLTHAHEMAKVDSVGLKSILYSIDRVGVPLFLMASGILSLDKAKDKGLSIFKSKRLYQFIFLFIFYSITTNAIFYHEVNFLNWGDSTLKALEFNNILNYGKNGYAVHLWYMFLFIPLYVLSPYISKMLSLCSNKEIFFYLVICITLNQLPRTYDAIMEQGTILSSLYKDFTGACLTFFIFGHWYCKAFQNSKVNTLNLTVGIILTCLVCYLKYNYEVQRGQILWALNWYNSSLSIAIASFGLFVTMYEITKNIPSAGLVTFLSKHSFGVYLIHYGILLIVLYGFKENIESMNTSFKILTLFSITLISFPISYLLSKNKFTGWLTGY